MSEIIVFVIVGLAAGAVYSLAGVGLVLTYRTSGLLNFAQGAVATVSAYLFYTLYVQHGVPWPVAALLSIIGVGVVFGFVMELIARKLQGAALAVSVARMVLGGRLPVLRITRVDGVAIGAGCDLALRCDPIVASDRARFWEIFTRRALSVDAGGSWLVPRLVGLYRAKELCFLAGVISVDDARGSGLVNSIVAADELDRTVDEFAEHLAAARSSINASRPSPAVGTAMAHFATPTAPTATRSRADADEEVDFGAEWRPRPWRSGVTSAGAMNAPPRTGGTQVEDVMIRFPKTFDTNATVFDIREFFQDDHVHMALIVAPEGELVTAIERSDLSGKMADSSPATCAGTLTGRTLSPHYPVQAAKAGLVRAGRRRAAVVDAANHLVGLVCLKKSGDGFCSDEGVRARAEERQRGRATRPGAERFHPEPKPELPSERLRKSRERSSAESSFHKT